MVIMQVCINFYQTENQMIRVILTHRLKAGGGHSIHCRRGALNTLPGGHSIHCRRGALNTLPEGGTQYIAGGGALNTLPEGGHSTHCRRGGHSIHCRRGALNTSPVYYNAPRNPIRASHQIDYANKGIYFIYLIFNCH